MLDRNRLDQFTPEDFLTEPRDHADYAEARRIQDAGLLFTQIRERADLSLEYVADKIGLRPELMRRIEKGQVIKSPSISLILQVLEVCDQEIYIQKKYHL